MTSRLRGPVYRLHIDDEFRNELENIIKRKYGRLANKGYDELFQQLVREELIRLNQMEKERKKRQGKSMNMRVSLILD